MDHRSYRRQGKDIIPTTHLGVRANGLEKRGIPTDRGEQNRQAQRNRHNQLELALLEQEKATILAEEKKRLSKLKNRYLEKVLELGEKKAAARKMHTQAEDSRARARSLTDLGTFMDQTHNRIASIGQELQGKLDPTRRVILERQQAQLKRSLQEDRGLLFSQHALTPEQITTRAGKWRSQAAALEMTLSESHELGFLEKLLEKLLRLLLDALRDLSGHLEPDFSLRSLEPFAQREELSPDKQQILSEAERRLEHTICQDLDSRRLIEAPTQEQTQGFSRGI